MAVKTVGQEFVILISIALLTLCSAQSGVRGPPQAEKKELKKVGHIGETIKLICPIQGYPTPMVEWYKDGDKIDYMWDTYRISRKSLKIKHVTEDDTGIFTCKGINGFGSDEVRIELIVVDPRILPQGIEGDDVAPPVFTHETKISQKFYSKSIGDTFKVSCEALGSPQPELYWFKNGQHISDSVVNQRGRSTVELHIYGTADSGTYTCRARNLLGEETMNFTLTVEPPQGAPRAIVTEAGPINTTVTVGDEAVLQCKVKSIDQSPHIKWLKRLEPYENVGPATLEVGQERYRVLDTNTFIAVGDHEYLNKLIIDRTTLEDSGLYICFVTNSGFGALTYKSMTLKVVEPTIEISVNNNENKEGTKEPIEVLIIVIVLSVIVFVLLVVILTCVCLKKTQNKDHSDVQSSTGASDVERPFMPQTNPQLLMKNNNKMLNKPLPPTPMTLAQWSSAIHPQTSPKYSADSGFNDHDNSKELNQYEVPYAHLLTRPYRAPEDIYFTQEAFMQPQNSVVSGYMPPQRLYTQQQRYYTEYETQ